MIAKTGTLGQGSTAAEAWFVGAIPQYSLAVGMFTDKPYGNPPQNLDGLPGIGGIGGSFGGAWPATIWHTFMSEHFSSLAVKDLPTPDYNGFVKWIQAKPVKKKKPKCQPQHGHHHHGFPFFGFGNGKNCQGNGNGTQPEAVRPAHAVAAAKPDANLAHPEPDANRYADHDPDPDAQPQPVRIAEHRSGRSRRSGGEAEAAEGAGSQGTGTDPRLGRGGNPKDSRGLARRIHGQDRLDGHHRPDLAP